MEKEQWDSCLKKVTGGEWPVPAWMVRDQSDWRCRSNMGRVLYFNGDTETALEVLSTVVDEEVDMEDAPEQGLSQAEHKVLCLRDISEIILKLAGDKKAALYYLDEAIKLGRSYRYRFHGDARGLLWYRRLALLSDMGREDEAIKDASAMIEDEKKDPHAVKAAEGDETYAGTNPYIYYSLRFLAEKAHEKGDDKKAADLFDEAYGYVPLNEVGKKTVAAARDEKNDAERFAAFAKSARYTYLPWERQPVVKRYDNE